MSACILKNHALLTVLQVYFASFYAFHLKLLVYFGDFIAQKILKFVLTAQENPLLDCLRKYGLQIIECRF